MNQLTRKSQEALQRAAGIARDESHPEVGTAHLLAALLEQDAVLSLLQKAGLAPTTIRNRALELVDAQSAAYGGSGEVAMGGGLRRALEAAAKEAEALGDDYISTEHLLLALADAGDRTAKALEDSGVTRDAVLSGLKAVRGSQ